jgi:GNAT superfamily N-acetyltransferase
MGTARAVALIRSATPEDAHTVAEVHVRSWQHAYRGLLPEAYLDGLSVEERAQRRLEAMAQAAPNAGMLVAEVDGTIVGFASFCSSRDDDAEEDVGEVPAIYLDPEVVGRGIGRRLFEAVADELRRAGFRRATLWVLEANDRARRFYEKAGWRWDGTVSRHDFDCANEPVVRYAVDL